MTRRARRAAYWRRNVGLEFAKTLLNEPSRREVRRAERLQRRPSKVNGASRGGNMLDSPYLVDQDAQKWCSERLIEILLPSGRGFLAVLEAYFDESAQETGEFCVAGYVYTTSKAKRFSKEWLGATKGRPFHATDAASRQAAFAGFSQDDVGRL